MLNKLSRIIFIFMLAAGISVNAQFKDEQIQLTGNLSADSKIIGEGYQQVNFNVMPPADGKKSPILAGLMSLVVPGAGEVYSGEYLKAGIFLAVEAAVITVAVIHDQKGDDKTEEFQNYADENWSAIRYARWLIQYEDADPAIIKSDDPNIPDWEEIDWKLLNASEARFSHKLPVHGEQQYYELIGKYPQYSPGWNDFAGGSDYHIIPANLTYYSGMRGDANDYYNVAAKAVIGIYVNHFLSMLDAVWSTINYNKDLSVSVRVEQMRYADNIELVPKLNLSLSF